MIIRGVSRNLVNATNLGFRTFDPHRPDKGPSRPGYVWVADSAIDPPPPPVFEEVSYALGILTVTLSCAETVDGYQVALTSDIGEPGTWGSTTTNTYTQSCNSGSYYLQARSVRGGMVSTWSIYGQLSPDEDEWRQVYSDQTVSASGISAYPGVTEDIGSEVCYCGGLGTFTNVANANYGAGGQDPTKGRFTNFFLGEYGGRYRFKFRDNPTSAYTRVFGGIFCCAGASSDFYILGVRLGAGTYTPYLTLWKSVGGSVSVVDEDVIPSAAYYEETISGGTFRVFELDLQAKENAFRGYCRGQLILDTTDSAIPWEATTIHAGLYMDTEPWIAITRVGLTDYLEVYARDRTGDPVVVDPGDAVDSLREGILDAAFNLSHLVRWCSGNSDTDYLHLRLDDTTPKKLLADLYNPYTDGSPSQSYEILRTSVASTITAQHSFSPSGDQAPFLLGAHAQGQLVTGLNADLLDGHDSSYFATAASISGTIGKLAKFTSASAVGDSIASESGAELTIADRLVLKETIAPTNAANYSKIYSKAADHLLYWMDQGGTERNFCSGTGTDHRVTKWNGTTGALEDGLLSDDGTTLSGTGRLSLTDNSSTINVIYASTTDADSCAMYGHATTGTGVYGDATAGAGVYGTATTGVGGMFASGGTAAIHVTGGTTASLAAYIRSYSAQTVQAFQSATLTGDVTAPVAQIYRDHVLSGHDATAAVLLVEDRCAASGALITAKKWSAALSATSDVWWLTTANDGRSASARWLSYNTGASAWNAWDLSTTLTGLFTVSLDTVTALSLDGTTLWLNDVLAVREGTAPSATASYTKIYSLAADSRLHWMDDSGTAYSFVSGTGTLNYLPKWTSAVGDLGNSILSDDGTTVSGTGRISMTDNTGSINVINARTAGAGSNAIRGYTSSSGYGVFGMCDGGVGAGFVGYGYKGSMAGFVYQGDALLASSTNATLLIQKKFTLGAYTATGALIDAGDYTASTGDLATWRKFSATLSATAIVGKLFTANDGRTVTERFYGYDTTASAWRYWDWATTTDSKLKLYYNNATTTCWESNGTAIKHTVTDAVTNAVTITSVVDHQSSGTPAEGFGGGLKFTLESSTTAERDAAQISTDWTDATDATRTSALRLWTVTGAAALEERLAILGGETVINDGGLDRDFRVEGDTDANLFTLDAGLEMIGIGCVPTAKLDINSDVLRLRTSKTPTTAGASGNAGDICWDADYVYVCVATDTWKKAAIATWV